MLGSQGAPGKRTSWAALGRGARLFRVAHGAWGVLNLGALGWVWLSVLKPRRDPILAASVVLLTSEGVALLVGRGDCPFGPFQRSLGDPVPMFEWVLPPRAAKAAIPVLAAVSLIGLAAVALRKPHQSGYRNRARVVTEGGVPDILARATTKSGSASREAA